jgi:hypothetical protein
MVSASSLLGAAGEHFVMCELLRRGFIAALAPAGVPNCDIVVTDDIGDRLFAIQVKTRRALGSDGGWHMGKKHESLVSPTLFYCFLDFGKSPDDHPLSFVVPAAVVAETLAVSHQAWLARPGARGQQRKDGDFRRFLPSYTHVGLDGHSAGWLDRYRDG